MKCDSRNQKYLAELAAHEETVTMLEARLASLPEQARLEELLEQRAEQRQQAALTRSSAREKKQSVERLRQDVGKLRARAKANLKALSAEVDRERRRDLKHDLAATRTRLDVLEQRLRTADDVAALFADDVAEDGDGSGGATATSGGGAEGELDRAVDTARRDVEQARNAIGADIAAAQSRAQQARSQISGEVLEAYDRQRAEHGVGAARLHGRTCQGCFMELDPAFLREVNNSEPDKLLRCPECNVLLLTSKESP